MGKQAKIKRRNRNRRRREAGLLIHRTENDTMKDKDGKKKGR